MKLFDKDKIQDQFKSQNALKGGSYSLAVVAVTLAILIVINIFVSALPTNLTKYDMSATKLYSVTSNTKAVVNKLEDDITIYWIVQSGEEDKVVENLLGKYESLSEHIKVVKKNPDIFPTFTEQYTSETVGNNSLIVECGDRYRYIGIDDIYLEEVDMNMGYSSMSFDGEGAITSAIDYVTTEELPKVYILEGHGEAELPSGFSEQLEKDNIETEKISLLNIDKVPEDADGLIIYAPSSDISVNEKEMLDSYVNSGGKLLVMAGTEENNLENLNSILADYNVDVVDGIVIEEQRENYAFGQPHVILPQMESHEITQSLIDENYYPIMPISQGLVVNDTSGVVTKLLTTSETSFSKPEGMNIDNYDREEGDTEGSFALGVSISAESGGQIIWYSSSAFIEDMYNAFSSGANMDLTMNSLSSLLGEREAMAIRTKSLDYNYLTISDSTAAMLKLIMIGIIPLAYFGVGVFIIIKRRREQNETN